MKAVVIETNILIAANQKTEQASPECVLACVSALEEAKQKRITLIDSGMRIFDEYRRHASFSGQPGLGDGFFKWLWVNQAHPKHCMRVDITPKDDDSEDFNEFPNDPELESFDRSDRKFVAVARASKHKTKVVNASDTDWWHHREALRRHGVEVLFLCPDLMA